MTYIVTFTRDGRQHSHEMSTRAQAQALADYISRVFPSAGAVTITNTAAPRADR